MIQKVELYQAVCDGCGRKFEGTYAYATKVSAILAAWSLGHWENIDGKIYCPDCVEWTPETKSYKPKKKKQ